MKRLLLLTLLASPAYGFDGTPTETQYGGPPMWSRDRRDYEPRRPYGPQFGPCIYYGDCAGPRWGDPYARPPFRLPPPPSRRYWGMS